MRFYKKISLFLVVLQLFLPVIVSANPFQEGPIRIQQTGQDDQPAVATSDLQEVAQGDDELSSTGLDDFRYNRNWVDSIFSGAFAGILGGGIGGSVGAIGLLALGIGGASMIWFWGPAAIGAGAAIALSESWLRGSQMKEYEGTKAWLEKGPPSFEPEELRQANLRYRNATVQYENARMSGEASKTELKELESKLEAAKAEYLQGKKDFISDFTFNPDNDPRIQALNSRLIEAESSGSITEVSDLRQQLADIIEVARAEFEFYKRGNNTRTTYQLEVERAAAAAEDEETRERNRRTLINLMILDSALR